MKILLVEDNPGDRRLIREYIRSTSLREATLREVDSGEEALEILEKERFHVLLLDLGLPTSQGLGTLQIFRTFAKKLSLVVLTGLEDQEMATLALKMGAQDYLYKDQCTSDLLEKTLRYSLERKSSQDRIMETEHKYRMLFENMMEGCFFFRISRNSEENLHLNLLDANAAGEKMLDFSFSRQPNASLEKVFSCFPPEHLQRICEVARTKNTDSFEVFCPSRKKIFHMALFCVNSFLACILQDITKEYTYKDHLEKQTARLHQLFQHAPVGIVESGNDGKIEKMNLAFQRIFGLFSEKAPLKIQEFMPSPTEEIQASEENMSFIEGYSSYGENQDLYIRYSTIPIRFQENTTGYYNMFEDISLGKKAKDLLKESHRELKQQYVKLQHSWAQTIEILTRISEATDPYTAGHQKRVAKIAHLLAKALGFSPEEQEWIRMAASIHDIGKIKVPKDILSKPGELSDLEFRFIRLHSQCGYDMLKDLDFPLPLGEIIYQHHERLDGSGYPRGLKGESILIHARIISVADVLEAMSSHRPYRPKLGVHAALEELRKNSGTLYDSRVVRTCVSLMEKGILPENLEDLE